MTQWILFIFIITFTYQFKIRFLSLQVKFSTNNFEETVVRHHNFLLFQFSTDAQTILQIKEI